MSRVALALAAAGALAGSSRVAQSQGRARIDDPRPEIYRGGDGRWLVDLPGAAEDAISRYNRDFEPWTVDDYAGRSCRLRADAAPGSVGSRR